VPLRQAGRPIHFHILENTRVVERARHRAPAHGEVELLDQFGRAKVAWSGSTAETALVTRIELAWAAVQVPLAVVDAVLDLVRDCSAAAADRLGDIALAMAF